MGNDNNGIFSSQLLDRALKLRKVICKCMAAKDRFHDAVQRALEKDGWTIVTSPLTFKFGEVRF
ncbi:MAG: element excision factor XisH family protein [Geitlerinemataceae cyanobacterium]